MLAFTTARWQTILTGARAGKLLARPTAAQKTRPGADTHPSPDLPPKELTTSTTRWLSQDEARKWYPVASAPEAPVSGGELRTLLRALTQALTCGQPRSGQE